MRVAQQRPRNRHALLLAAGERRGVTVEQLRLEADFIEVAPSRSSEKSPSTPTGRMQRLSRTVPSNITGVCMTSATRHRSSRGIERSDVTAIESHRPGRRLDETVETAQHARLPGPGRADKRERTPTLHAERDIVQDVHCGMAARPGIAEQKMIDLENRIVHFESENDNLVCRALVQDSYPVKLSQHRPVNRDLATSRAR